MIDRFAEKYVNLSPYNYCANNPIKYIDPNGDTITLSDSYLNSEALMDAHSRWRSSEAGQEFYKLFDVGGKFEEVAVYFGTDKDAVKSGGMSDASGDTQINAVNEETGEKTQLYSQQNIDAYKERGRDASKMRSHIKRGEYLRFDVNTEPPALYKVGTYVYFNNKHIEIKNPRVLPYLNQGRINRKTATINHESKHVRMITNDMATIGAYYYSPATQHYYMENPREYPYKNKNFLTK